MRIALCEREAQRVSFSPLACYVLVGEQAGDGTRQAGRKVEKELLTSRTPRMRLVPGQERKYLPTMQFRANSGQFRPVIISAGTYRIE